MGGQMISGRAARVQAITEQVSLVDTLGSRWLGTFIDLLVIGPFAFGVLAISGLVFPDNLLWGLLPAVMVFGAYFVIGEAIWGRTVGKLVAGTIVVNGLGYPPGFKKAIIRTVARFVEVNPLFFGGVPAAIYVALHPRRQRLGDAWAGTYVIPMREFQTLGVTARVS